jgi:hypothetical protein
MSKKDDQMPPETDPEMLPPAPVLPPTVDGQCQEPGCKSTRAPNGAPYTCPVHVKQ